MPAPKPPIARHRARVEAALRIAAPMLDLVLATGDRLSRTFARAESDDAPAAIAGGSSRALRAGPQGSD